MLSVHVCVDQPEPCSPRRRRRPGTRARPSNDNPTPLVQTRPTPPSKIGSRTEGSTSVAAIAGQRASSALPPRDTPGVIRVIRPAPDGLSRTDAEAAWHAVTRSIAGTPHVRISKDGGRTYPARHARQLPADPPDQPSTVPVYDPGSGTGRLLALDLDPARVRGSVAGDPQGPDPGNAGEGRPPRRPFFDRAAIGHGPGWLARWRMQSPG